MASECSPPVPSTTCLEVTLRIRPVASSRPSAVLQSREASLAQPPGSDRILCDDEGGNRSSKLGDEFGGSSAAGSPSSTGSPSAAGGGVDGSSVAADSVAGG